MQVGTVLDYYGPFRGESVSASGTLIPCPGFIGKTWVQTRVFGEWTIGRAIRYELADGFIELNHDAISVVECLMGDDGVSSKLALLALGGLLVLGQLIVLDGLFELNRLFAIHVDYLCSISKGF